MSRTDESGRDGLREAVERLADELASRADDPLVVQLDRRTWRGANLAAARNLRALLAEHPPTPAEEPAEVAVEEREAIYRAAMECVRGECDHEYDHECVSDWLRDHDAALTAKAKAEAWDEGYGQAGSEAPFLYGKPTPNPYRDRA